MGRNFFDELAEQDARVQRVSGMVPNEGELTPEQRRRILHDLERFLEEHGLTQADLARGIREPQSVISWLFSKNPSQKPLKPEKRDEVLRKAAAWIELEHRAITSREQRPASYYPGTKPAERLMAIARRLTERADMGVAWGPAGIGESTIVKALQAELPNAVVVTVRENTRKYCGFLSALHRAMNRRRRTAGRVYQDDVTEQLRQSARVASRPLIIVDQAHNLHSRVLSLLMDLHEEAGCSVLLVGTIDAAKRVTYDDTIEFGQLSSRFGVRCNLAPEVFEADGRSQKRKLFTVKDVRAIFQRGKLRLHTDAAELLARTANTSNGHLRRVDRLLPWAYAIGRKRCGREDAMVIAADVYEASRIVEGEDQRLTLPVEVGGREAAAG